MIKIQKPSDCCGCSACASICNYNAITMQPDTLGFLYPVVDESKCTNCGLCEKVCAFNGNYDTSLNFIEPIAYGARQKDINEVMKSRSGAVFAAIADHELKHGGIVYGAGYTDHFRVVHKRATTKEEYDEFRGSKYVQSDLNGTFRQVKKDLKDGLTVLFSGTPCQTSGLNSYIGKKLRTNLILVDIVCHGVPAPYIWRDYIALLEKQQGSPITWVNFRDKSQFGWRDHREMFKFLNSEGKSEGNMWFTRTFFKDIINRHSCSNCHFCNIHRPSDITIADFWGWEKTGSSINQDNKGVNLVLINTEKGREIFGTIKDRLEIVDARPDAYMQPNLQRPTPMHRERMRLEKDYKKYGFEYVYHKEYHKDPPAIRFLKNGKDILRKILNNFK